MKLAIIYSFNDSRILKVLKILKRISLPKNVIFVFTADLKSSDLYHTYKRDYGSKKIKFVLSKSSNYIGSILNDGINSVKSEYYYILDSSCILNKQTILEALNNKNVDVVINGFINFYGDNLVGKLDAKLRLNRYMHDTSFAYCPNIIIPKSIFDKIGLFSDNYKYGSDAEFAKRLQDNNIKTIYNKKLIVDKNVTDSLRGVCSKWIKYGKGRYKRYMNSPLKIRLQSLVNPILFRKNESLLYNLFFVLCLLFRWVGMTQEALRLWLKSKK